MSTWRDWFVIIVGLFVCLLIVSDIAVEIIKLTQTDIDCWWANDPIVCQKIKDGAK